MKIVEKISKLKELPGVKDKSMMMPVVIGVVIIGIIVLLFVGTKDTKRIISDVTGRGDTGSGRNEKDVGILVGSVDTKSYIQRIEKQYYEVTSKVENTTERLQTLEKTVGDMRKNINEVKAIIDSIDKRVTETITYNIGTLKKEMEKKQIYREAAAGGATMGNADTSLLGMFQTQSHTQVSGNSLEIAKVGDIIKDKESKKPETKYVYLPTGSFVKATLLTGVYAPADESNPLPVLLSINEAFYGPNNSRVPLKGIFAIGKAIGDLVSKRAIVQIVSMSAVLDNGRVFEHEGNIGYLTDASGQLGIPGEVIYNTGKQLSLNFLSGFLSGAAEALSQTETTSTQNAYGTSNRNVTGDSSKYAMFSGLSSSAEGMTEYYQRQLEDMIPAVKIEPGVEVTFIVQKGVEIEGFEVAGHSYGYIE